MSVQPHEKADSQKESSNRSKFALIFHDYLKENRDVVLNRGFLYVLIVIEKLEVLSLK